MRHAFLTCVAAGFLACAVAGLAVSVASAQVVPDTLYYRFNEGSGSVAGVQRSLQPMGSLLPKVGSDLCSQVAEPRGNRTVALGSSADAGAAEHPPSRGGLTSAGPTAKRAET